MRFPIRKNFTSAASAIALTVLVSGCAVMQNTVDNYYSQAQVQLIKAVRVGDSASAQEALKAGADPNFQDAFDNKRTSLMNAARKGDLEIVQMLLAAGANPNIADPIGETALFKAAAGGHGSVVDALVASGADVNMRNTQGETAAKLLAGAYSGGGSAKTLGLSPNMTTTKGGIQQGGITLSPRNIYGETLTPQFPGLVFYSSAEGGTVLLPYVMANKRTSAAAVGAVRYSLKSKRLDAPEAFLFEISSAERAKTEIPRKLKKGEIEEVSSVSDGEDHFALGKVSIHVTAKASGNSVQLQVRDFSAIASALATVRQTSQVEKLLGDLEAPELLLAASYRGLDRDQAKVLAALLAGKPVTAADKVIRMLAARGLVKPSPFSGTLSGSALRALGTWEANFSKSPLGILSARTSLAESRSHNTSHSNPYADIRVTMPALSSEAGNLLDLRIPASCGSATTSTDRVNEKDYDVGVVIHYEIERTHRAYPCRFDTAALDAARSTISRLGNGSLSVDMAHSWTDRDTSRKVLSKYREVLGTAPSPSVSAPTGSGSREYTCYLECTSQVGLSSSDCSKNNAVVKVRANSEDDLQDKAYELASEQCKKNDLPGIFGVCTPKTSFWKNKVRCE